MLRFMARCVPVFCFCLSTLFWGGLNGLLAVSAIRCSRIIRSTIAKAVPATSAAAATAAPFACAFPLWFLLCGVLYRCAFRGLLRCLVPFVSGLHGRHDLLRLNRSLVFLCAAGLDDGGF